jgi:hypothetical protein
VLRAHDLDRRTADLLLVATSAAQPVAGCAGLAIALRRRYAYDWLFLHGDPARFPLEASTLGTGLSAPLPMLLAQAAATVSLARRRRPGAARVTLGALGALMVPGYLGERVVRRLLSHHGWQPVESPVACAGLLLAAMMPVLTWRASDL